MPTSSASSPSAQTISVVEGSNETIRITVLAVDQSEGAAIECQEPGLAVSTARGSYRVATDSKNRSLQNVPGRYRSRYRPSWAVLYLALLSALQSRHSISLKLRTPESTYVLIY